MLVITFLLIFLKFTSSVAGESELSPRSRDNDENTAAGSIEEANKKVKPHRTSSVEKYHFDKELLMADQLFEGCLLLDEKDKKLLSGASGKDGKRTHVSLKEKMWPSNDIPYTVDSLYRKKSDRVLFRNAIQKAIKSIESKTCIRFRKKNAADENWISFYTGSGCYSQLGRKNGEQKETFISLDRKCWKPDIALHMILHAFGFFHEQNRIDRNEYIKVNWENVAPGRSSIFHRHALYNTETYHNEYDYESIMHFQRNSYSKRPELYTLQARKNQNRILGGVELSKLDIEKLNQMFCPSDYSGWTQWSSCSSSCGIGHRFRKAACKGMNCRDKKYQMEACRLRKCIGQNTGETFEAVTGAFDVPEWYPHSCDWTIMKSKGNFKDHSTGAGSFLQANVQRSCKFGEKASLATSLQPMQASERCLNFYYVLSGEKVGSLKLFIRNMKGGSKLIWEKSGNQGDEWKPGAATIPMTNYQTTIEFVFVNGNGPNSKALLDDIFIDDNKCSQGMQQCANFYGSCESWAEDGECFLNPNFMLQMCCGACRESKCINVQSERSCKASVENLSDLHCTKQLWQNCCSTCRDCLDWSPRCEEWAKIGECDSNAAWMKANCKKSCGECFKGRSTRDE